MMMRMNCDVILLFNQLAFLFEDCNAKYCIWDWKYIKTSGSNYKWISSCPHQYSQPEIFQRRERCAL